MPRSTSLNNLIAPTAPVRVMLTGPSVTLELNENVPLYKFPGRRVAGGVNVTPTEQLLEAVIAVVGHVLLVIVKCVGSLLVNPERVTELSLLAPVTVMETDCSPLEVAPVGTPNARTAGGVGEVDTVCAKVTFPLTSNVQSRSKHTATPRKPIAKNLILPSLRAYHIQ